MRASLGVAASILLALAAVSAPTAAEADPFCALVLHEERIELQETKLSVDVAEARVVAAETIFVMADALWKDELIERIRFRLFEHERDVAVIGVRLQELFLERQEALTEQLAILCSSPGKGDEAERNVRREAAHQRYLHADCQTIGSDLAIAEVDLAYLEEVLVSIRDLRENDVATREDVIRAEEDVAVARRRVEHDAPRFKACDDSSVAAADD
jgi:hypothetical protein